MNIMTMMAIATAPPAAIPIYMPSCAVVTEGPEVRTGVVEEVESSMVVDVGGKVVTGVWVLVVVGGGRSVLVGMGRERERERERDQYDIGIHRHTLDTCNYQL